MNLKSIQISSDVHRDLDIQAATAGVSMKSIAERAIRRELLRIKKQGNRKQKPQRSKEAPHALATEATE